MAKQIQEYDWSFGATNQAAIAIPGGGEIIGVRLEGAPWSEALKLFAIVDPSLPTQTRTFALFRAGDGLPDDYKKFIGVFRLMRSGTEFFYYVFEV